MIIAYKTTMSLFDLFLIENKLPERKLIDYFPKQKKSCKIIS